MPRRIRKREYRGQAASQWLLPDWEWLFSGLPLNRYDAPNPFLYFSHELLMKRLKLLWETEKERIMRFWENPETEPDFPFADEILLFNNHGKLFDRPHIFWLIETDGEPIEMAEKIKVLSDLGELTEKEKQYLKTEENEH